MKVSLLNNTQCPNKRVFASDMYQIGAKPPFLIKVFFAVKRLFTIHFITLLCWAYQFCHANRVYIWNREWHLAVVQLINRFYLFICPLQSMVSCRKISKKMNNQNKVDRQLSVKHFFVFSLSSNVFLKRRLFINYKLKMHAKL